MENYTENAGREPWGRGSARPCTAEMRMDSSQKKFTDTTSIEHRTFTPTIRTLQCGHTAWGKRKEVSSGKEKEMANSRLVFFYAYSNAPESLQCLCLTAFPNGNAHHDPDPGTDLAKTFSQLERLR